jgi:hypothetical protein
MILGRYLRKVGWVGVWFFFLKGLAWLLVPMWLVGKGCST